jgi:hypothetical protein
MTRQHDDEFVRGLRTRLDEEIDRISPDDAARLGAARRLAVARAEQPRGPGARIAAGAPAWGVAAAAVLLMVLLLPVLEQSGSPGAPDQLAEVPVADVPVADVPVADVPVAEVPVAPFGDDLSAGDALALADIDLLEEMAFVAWLEYEAEWAVDDAT